MSSSLLATTHKTDFYGYLSFLSILPKIILNIKNWNQFLLTYSDRYKGVIKFRDGFKLYVDDSSDISSVSTSFFRHDYGVMNPNWHTIVDIGAHKGFFTSFAAKHSPKAKIYSFEPIKGSFIALNKNLNANRLKGRVRSFNLGVAGKEGQREINLTVSSTDNTFYTQIGSTLNGTARIKCTTLAKILKDNKIKTVDLLKLDCEGAEFEILMDSDKETLKLVSEIRMEYHNIDKQKNISKLIHFLKKSGYDLLEQRKSTNRNIGYARFSRRVHF